MSRVSKSVGRECAAFGCSTTFYNYDGTPSGLHFFITTRIQRNAFGVMI